MISMTTIPLLLSVCMSWVFNISNLATLDLSAATTNENGQLLIQIFI